MFFLNNAFLFLMLRYIFHRTLIFRNLKNKNKQTNKQTNPADSPTLRNIMKSYILKSLYDTFQNVRYNDHIYALNHILCLAFT